MVVELADSVFNSKDRLSQDSENLMIMDRKEQAKQEEPSKSNE